MLKKLARVFYYARSFFEVRASQNYAEMNGLVGLDFAKFSQRKGFRLLSMGNMNGLRLITSPVVYPRFFEFSFAWRHLGLGRGNFLDVSSPKLFSLYVAERLPNAKIAMINPDRSDAQDTANLIASLSVTNITVKNQSLETFSAQRASYDCIWAISVVEHISGDIDDRSAISRMRDLLAPGGILIVTVPVAPEYREEFRESDAYGLGAPKIDGLYFYQRWYDRVALKNRIEEPFGASPIAIDFVGEKKPGALSELEDKRLRLNVDTHVNAARDAIDNMTIFESFEDMRGVGIACLAFRKA